MRVIVHCAGEVYTNQDLGEHLYTIGIMPPNHPVPVPMETAKFYPCHWHWIVFSLYRMKVELHRDLVRNRGKSYRKRLFNTILGYTPSYWKRFNT